MKVQMTSHIEVETVFEAPLYGFDIEKTYTKILKHQIKSLITKALDQDLTYLEHHIDGVLLKVKIGSSIHSLNKK